MHYQGLCGCAGGLTSVLSGYLGSRPSAGPALARPFSAASLRSYHRQKFSYCRGDFLCLAISSRCRLFPLPWHHDTKHNKLRAKEEILPNFVEKQFSIFFPLSTDFRLDSTHTLSPETKSGKADKDNNNKDHSKRVKIAKPSSDFRNEWTKNFIGKGSTMIRSHKLKW